MNKREEIISLWFEMWLQKKDLGIFKIFSNNATYIESWGRDMIVLKKLNFGLMSGIVVELFLNGILSNFFTRKIKQ